MSSVQSQQLHFGSAVKKTNTTKCNQNRPNFSPMVAVHLIVCAVLMCSAPTVTSLQAQTETDTAKSTLIETILTEQTNAWNEGDLDKFMQTYWKSDKLTFCSGGKTTYGWQSTLDNYKKSYPTKSKMGRLHFDGLEVSMIESNSALVLGKWHLKMEDDSNRDGNFSLVVKKIDDQWKIIHDHSSSLEPLEGKD